MTLVVLLTLFDVLADERLIVEGGFPRQDGGRTTKVSRVDKGDLT